MIHPSVEIHPTAHVAEDVVIGAFSVIGPKVTIGRGCRIGPHVVIKSHTTIGTNNTIHAYAAIGCDPQDLSYQGEEVWLSIGDRNIIHEFVTLSRASTKGDYYTRIGDDNLLMAYSHVGHDCLVGNHIQFINNGSIAGHCVIDDYAMIGAFSLLHQFCRVGSYSFLTRSANVVRDVPPYLIATGNPAKPSGLNVVGLKRAGFKLAQIQQIKAAYKIIYDSGLSLEGAVDQLEAFEVEGDFIQPIVDMIKHRQRGIIR